MIAPPLVGCVVWSHSLELDSVVRTSIGNLAYVGQLKNAKRTTFSLKDERSGYAIISILLVSLIVLTRMMFYVIISIHLVSLIVLR